MGSRERGLSAPSLMAIRMWSVWNSGLYSWASTNKKDSPPGVRKGAHLDYLLLHVEDLIDSRAKVGCFTLSGIYLLPLHAQACDAGLYTELCVP